MTAPAAAIGDRPAARPGGIVKHTDLFYPGQRDPIGLDMAKSGGGQPDPLRYVVWVARPRDSGWLPKLALHVNHVRHVRSEVRSDAPCPQP
jgi:hypothetical protein